MNKAEFQLIKQLAELTAANETLKAEVERLQQALREYAISDDIEQGFGYGVFTDAIERVERVINGGKLNDE